MISPPMVVNARSAGALPALIASALLALAPGAAPGQEASARPSADRGRRIVSMGQPGPVRYYANGEFGLAPVDDRKFIGRFALGVERTLFNPLAEVLAVNGEYYMGMSGEAEGVVGVRAGLSSPVLRFGGGVQYDFKAERARGYVQFRHPLRRGGIFWPGGQLRVLWAPGSEQSLTFGVNVPLGQPFAGRTRPRSTRAEVALPIAGQTVTPPAPPNETRAILAQAREDADLIRRMYVPFVDHGGSNLDAAAERFTRDMAQLAEDALTVDSRDAGAAGRSDTPPEAVVRRFHESMHRAFEMACGQCVRDADAMYDAAHEALLDELIFPYNRMLGQKKAPTVFDELAARARVAFARSLVLEYDVPPQEAEPAQAVFAELVESLRAVVEAAGESWGDDRMIFLPIQLGLLPEDHDSQAEIDALVERALDRPLVGGNEVWYVVSEQFQYELLRMIHAAQQYHVLWIHDFRGYDDQGDPDAVAFRIVLDGYLRALAERLEAFDREGHLPVYMIFIDQWFYEANQGRLWLTLLENPLTHEIELPEGFEDWERQIRDMQDRIRHAIERSDLLQTEVREYGADWLYNRVKVHVSVTDPADATFWTDELVPLIGMPDAVMRDHRKMAFYDVHPDDPEAGMALFTGMGVGEHYTGPTWDDRAVLVRGPVLLYLRTEARDLLLQQGFRPEQIPFPLQVEENEHRVDYAPSRSPQGEAPSRAIQLHNHIGYGPKNATVLKATLYNLMPSGAVSKSPDSLWNLPLWSSLLLGHALRGGQVAIVAPRDDTAPATSALSLSRAQEVLARTVMAARLLQAPLELAGGDIRVGFYDPQAGVADVPARLRQMAQTYRSEPWLAELHQMSDADLASFESLADSLVAAGFDAVYLEGEALDRPKLHMKAHLFMTAEAWEPLMARPETVEFLLEYARARAGQVGLPGEERDLRDLSDRLEPFRRRLLSSYQSSVSPAERERAGLFLVVGSHNQNYRSMALDGEVLVAVTGPEAAVGLADFILILGVSDWVTTPEEIEQHLPEAGHFFRRIARWAQIVG